MGTHGPFGGLGARRRYGQRRTPRGTALLLRIAGDARYGMARQMIICALPRLKASRDVEPAPRNAGLAVGDGVGCQREVR